MPNENKLQDEQVELKVADAEEQAPAELPSVGDDGAVAKPAFDMHGLLHSMKRAKCTTDWKNMVGDDRVRQCKICKVNTYKIDKLDGNEVAQLIGDHEKTPLTQQQKLFRRNDGTVMLRPGACGQTIMLALVCTVVLGLIAAAVNEMDLPLYVRASLITSSIASFIVALQFNAFRTLKRRQLPNAISVGLVTMAVAYVVRAMFEHSFTIWLPLRLAEIGAVMYLLVALVLDIRASRREKLADNGTSQTAAKLTPEAIATRKRNKRIGAALLAVIIPLLGYCIFDFSWCVKTFSVAFEGTTKQQKAGLEKLLPTTTGDRADAVRWQLALVDIRTDNFEDAKKQYRKMIEDLEPSGWNNQLLVVAHNGLAQLYLVDKNWTAAEQEANKALEILNSKYAERGGVRVVLNFYSPPGSEFRSEQTRRAQELLAHAYAGSKDFAKADRMYDMLLNTASEPGRQPAEVNIAFWHYVDYLLKNGRTADATTVTERGLELLRRVAKPESAFLAQSTAEAYERIKDPRAEEAFSKWLSIEDQHDGQTIATRLRFADYLASMHKDQKAERLYQQAIEKAQAKGWEYRSSDKRDHRIYVNADIYDADVSLCEYLVARSRAPEAASIMRELERHVRLNDMSERERLDYMESYSHVMQAAHDPSATKYDTKIQDISEKNPRLFKAVTKGFEKLRAKL